MVDKDKLIVAEARPNKSVSGLKVEDVQPKTSGGSVQPEPKLPEDAWRCFVTTTKDSKFLLFLKPTLDVKQILSEVSKRHNAQCKELGRIRGKYLALCQSEAGDGFKLTNDMCLKDFAPSPPVYLRAYVEDAVVAKRKTSGEGDDKPAKKAKTTPAVNGASGPGSVAAASEGPKKRGRPSNKEKAEREAAAALAATATGADKGKAPPQTQDKPAAAKKSSNGKVEAAAAAPAEVKKPVKVTPKTPAVDPKQEESSSEEESSSGEEEEEEDAPVTGQAAGPAAGSTAKQAPGQAAAQAAAQAAESASSESESSSEEEEEKSPEARVPESSSEEESSSGEDDE